MGVVAEISRLSCCAWAPSGYHLVAGTYAGAVDTSFEASSSLEVLQLDVPNARLVPGAPLRLPEKFSSIAWGPVSRVHAAGLIAGGFSDGSVRVWDAASLLRPSSEALARDPNRGLLLPANFPARHTGPVHGVSFNHFVCTLLATGGADSKVLIWDLANPSSPVVRPPGNMEPGSKDEIIAVSWNPKVQHILGTGSSTGVVSVWDLKNRKQVISIRNPRGRLRASSLVWHPHTPTQVLVTCDEDDGSGGQLWDLRNATAPLCNLAHHAPRGIMAASWCPHDADLVLTSSRDGRTVLASPFSGDVVAELSRSSTWNFDVHWSPRTPGVFLASSFDACVSVNSVLTANAAASVSAETAKTVADSFGPDVGDFKSDMAVQSPRTLIAERESVSMSHAPKWLRPPCAISFSFGGRVSFVTSKGGGTVTISQGVERNVDLTESLLPVDSLLATASPDDPSPLSDYCKKASSGASSPVDQIAWEVLALQFQTDSRRKMLEHLGYEPAPAVAGDMSDQVFGMQHSPVLANPVRPVDPESLDTSPGADLGRSAMAGPLDDTVSQSVHDLSIDGPAPWDVSGNGHDLNGESLLDDDSHGRDAASLAEREERPPASKSDKRDFSALDDSGIDATVKRAIVVGDFELAVDACLFAKRAADALVIAYAGGPGLWQRVQAEYVASANADWGTALIGAAAGSKNKMDDFIRSAASAKESWKEALALILSYVDGDGFVDACSALGHRVLENGDFVAALTCFLCAGNTRMITTVWMRGRVASGNMAATIAARIERLVTLVAKVRLVTSAVGLIRGEGNIGSVMAFDEVSASVLFEYGTILAEQGDIAEAAAYLAPLDPTTTGVRGLVQDAQSQVNESLAIKHLVDSGYNGDLVHGGMGYLDQNPSNVGAPAYVQTPGYGGLNSTGPGPAGLNPVAHSPSPVPRWGNEGYSQELSIQSQRPGGLPVPPMLEATAPFPVPVPGGLGTMAPQPGVPSPGGFNKTFYPSQAGFSEVATPATDSQVSNGYSVSTPAAPAAPAPQFPSSLGPPPSPARLVSPRSNIVNGGFPGSQRFAGTPAGLSSSGGLPAPTIPPIPASGLVGTLPDAPSTPGALPGSAAMPHAPMMPAVMMPAGGIGLGGAIGQAPPPPPQVAPDAPLPMSYHAKATPGAGSGLPPSSEVAVAKQRQKAPSASGVPSSAPRRSPSVSSSLSSMSVESNVPLDKVDVRNVPADQQVIVKSLRGAFQYALGRNSSMMYKKKMADVSKKLGRLVSQLNAKEVDSVIISKLVVMAQGIAKGDYDTAKKITASLGKEVDWESNRHWLQAMTRLIDAVLNGR